MTGEAARCALCGGTTRPGRRPWIWYCESCGFTGSKLESFGGSAEGGTIMDEELREQALRAIRKETLARVAQVARRLTSAQHPRLLEVGCGHGWFLEYVRDQGFAALGLEPDLPIARQAAATGLPVACGLFPDSIAARKLFDVVVFNDVLEHLPRLADVAVGIRAILNPSGLIVINGPSRNGVLYRLTEVADSIGIGGPLNRMWQQNLPSPHLSYFRPEDLVRLFASIGAREIHRSAIPSIRIAGLWSRVRYTRTESLASSVFQWVALAAVTPVLGVLPPDIVLQVFRLDEPS